jgi:hypothetical protein
MINGGKKGVELDTRAPLFKFDNIKHPFFNGALFLNSNESAATERPFLIN